jgi:hypothetical protein
MHHVWRTLRHAGDTLDLGLIPDMKKKRHFSLDPPGRIICGELAEPGTVRSTQPETEYNTLFVF